MKLEVYDVMYALNDVSDYLVMETAEKSRQLRERIAIKWASLAACVCLLCTAAVYSLYMSGVLPHMPPAGTADVESSGTADTDDTYDTDGTDGTAETDGTYDTDDTAETDDAAVTVITPPDKTEYLLGESPDLSGLSLRIRLDDGTVKTVSDGFTCDAGIFEDVGRVELTVGAGDTYINLPVTVWEPEVARISVETLPEKTEYFRDYPVDFTGFSLRVAYRNGYSRIIDCGFTHDGAFLRELGEVPVNIGYGGVSTSFTVNVSEEDSVVSATVLTPPDKTEYIFGERIDTSGLTLEVTHSDGTTEIVSDGFNISKYAYQLGKTYIPATYGGCPFDIYVTVESRDKDDIIASGKCGDSVTWTLDGTGALTVSGTGEMWSSEDTWFPIQDYVEVTRSVTIEDGVTSIGDYMFELQQSVTEVNIAPSVKTVGDYAFYSCTGIKKIVLPDGVETVGDYAFCFCSGASSLTLPDSLLHIGENAFAICLGLTSVTVPDSVLDIGASAFSSCELLREIRLPAGLEVISHGMFEDCKKLSSVTIPDSTKRVEYAAFAGCTALKSITFPESVVEINMTFGTNSKIEDVYIENADCEIGGADFTLGTVGVTTVHGRAGSTAEKRAKMYGFRFELIE